MSEELEPHETERLAAICFLFGLRRGEAKLLMSLMTHGFQTNDQLRAVVGHLKTSTVSVTLSTLRRKLQSRGIEITNLKTLGYLIDPKSRDKVFKLLEHNAAIILTHPKPRLDLKPEIVEGR